MMMKTWKYSCLVIALFIMLLTSCKKKKAENGLEGHWQVNSTSTNTVLDQYHYLADTTCGDQIVFSGELFLDKHGDGHVIINGTFCNSTLVLFDKNIEDLKLIDHTANFSLNQNQTIHRYRGSFNTNINFDCNSLSDKGIINKNTPEINFNILGLIDQSTGGYLEQYNLNLVLTRD